MPQSKSILPVVDGFQHLPEHTANFPIVGIGASAGGLEAMEHFFQHFPCDSGMAFVLVSHLAPNQNSALAEILQRTTTMPVVEIREQMLIVPNHVYVIPPNQSLTVFNRVLQLNVPEQPPGQRMLIDTFLRSLAEDQGIAAIGIILSGTGSDGTLGLRAILGAGGITLVQEPSTARFDGMPTSAIQAGYASYILPVEKMVQALISHQQIPFMQAETQPAMSMLTGIHRILMSLCTHTGHDFSQYKKSTIRRRIERRMAVHNIEDIDVYGRYLKENPTEMSLLFKELLINVTHFFRDSEAFAQLQELIFSTLFVNKPKDYTVRVWVAGCATGEEAYSIAMLLSEFIAAKQPNFKVQIYATDLDADAIAIARAGIYPRNIVQDVSEERLHCFFNHESDGSYRIKKAIREMVVFAVQNLIKDPPFTKLDVLSCRNVMIYLEAELQNRLLPNLHYALKEGGVLFLSPSESIGNHTDLFRPLNRQWKLYQALNSVSATRPLLANNLSWSNEVHITAPTLLKTTNTALNFAEMCKRALLQFYAPAAVMTDVKGNILYVHGETGKYLRPAPGQASLNVIEMAREGLPRELRLAIYTVAQQKKPTLNREIAVKTNGNFQQVSFSVRLLSKQTESDDNFLLISFSEMSESITQKPVLLPTPELQQVEELQRELAYARDNLQSTLEESNAAKEEFKCTHEEMQSTNEELQSTNEELETSKEELQSMNEELITVNSELQAKIVQLSEMQNDMKNLFDNIRIGIVFLDRQLKIRRFTREVTQFYRLVDSDIGRRLIDIKTDLHYDSLSADARAVLDTLVPCECEIQTEQGLTLQVRIQVYRTLDNLIDGVVITFNPVNKSTQLNLKQD